MGVVVFGDSLLYDEDNLALFMALNEFLCNALTVSDVMSMCTYRESLTHLLFAEFFKNPFSISQVLSFMR